MIPAPQLLLSGSSSFFLKISLIRHVLLWCQLGRRGTICHFLHTSHILYLTFRSHSPNGDYISPVFRSPQRISDRVLSLRAASRNLRTVDLIDLCFKKGSQSLIFGLNDGSYSFCCNASILKIPMVQKADPIVLLGPKI